MRKQVEKRLGRERGVVEKLLRKIGDLKNERLHNKALTDDMARENKRIEALLRKELADAENKVGEIESKLNESLLQERQLHDKDIAKLQDIRNKKSQIEKRLKGGIGKQCKFKGRS